MLSHFSCVWLCVTLWTASSQAPLSMGFSRQKYWSGWLYLPPDFLYREESEVAQSCPTLCDPMDCSLPGSSIHGIFQARILEWVAISFYRRSSRPRDWTQVSHIVGRRFTIWATRVAQMLHFPSPQPRSVDQLYCAWASQSKFSSVTLGHLIIIHQPTLYLSITFSLSLSSQLHTNILATVNLGLITEIYC